jgi:hypothetical protein
MVVVPAATLVASPLALMVATLGELELHVIVRPVSTVPFASFKTALNCTPADSTTAVGAAGVTVTEATGAGGGGGGAVTVSLVVPLTVSLVAVMVVVPAATLVASPLALMVATLGVLELHVTTRPVSTVPLASFKTALNCTPADPTTAVGAAGVTVTEATDAGGAKTMDTTAVAVPVTLALAPLIVTVPWLMDVPTPVVSTCMIDELLLCQSTRRPVRMFPAESRNVTLNCVACPIPTLTCAGVTAIEAIGAAPTTV